METESEPYVRLASLRQLHQVMADMNTARSLADTLQTVADGAVGALGYEMAAVNLVRQDGDLVVAAFSGNPAAEALITGRVGSRESWGPAAEHGRTLGATSSSYRTLRAGSSTTTTYPQWYTDGPEPRFEDEWHPSDRLFAPMYTPPARRAAPAESCSASYPSTGRATAAAPARGGREALQMYAFQAAIAISNARLRANMQRALVRLEREAGAARQRGILPAGLRVRPSGMAIAEMGGDQHGRILRTNDALCRLLGRPASAMRRYSFADLVHPEDIGTLLRTSAEGGARNCAWAAVTARTSGSPCATARRRGRRRRPAFPPHPRRGHRESASGELQLAHRASPRLADRLPNSAELRSRLSARPLPAARARRGPGSLDAAYGHPAFDIPAGHGFDFAPGAEAYDAYDHHVHTVALGGRPRRRHQGSRGSLLRPRRLQVDQRPVRAQRGRRGPHRRSPGG